jgi:hypothetical protein
MVQVIEHLLSKPKALSSDPNTTTKKINKYKPRLFGDICILRCVFNS